MRRSLLARGPRTAPRRNLEAHVLRNTTARQKDVSEVLSVGLWTQGSPCPGHLESGGASACSWYAPLMRHHALPMPPLLAECQRTQKEGGVLGTLLLQEWLWILRGRGPRSVPAGFSMRRRKRRIVTSPLLPDSSEPVDRHRGTFRLSGSIPPLPSAGRCFWFSGLNV